MPVNSSLLVRCALLLLPLQLVTGCGGGGSDPNPNPNPSPAPTDTTAPTTRATPAGGEFTARITVSLLCADEGGSGCAATHYTVDGSTPSASSPVFREAITISTSTSLKFFSVDKAGNAEPVKTEQYTFPSPTPVVTAAPRGGTYNSAQTVTLTCSEGAGPGCGAIHYTVDGTVPTASSPQYAAPLSVSTSITLRFIGIGSTGNVSPVVSEVYLIDTAGPVTAASPPGGPYASPRQVTLTCNDTGGAGCAATYYTLDGTEPGQSSSRYTAPLLVEQSRVLKFFSVDKAGNAEPLRTETYTIDSVPPSVSASPAGGSYASAQTVTLSCLDSGGAGCQAIHYTLDGSAPATSSPVYTAPVTISADTALRFLAVDRAGNSSGITLETYIIDQLPPATVASPAGGAYRQAQQVTLSCGDGLGSGCVGTYYTLDGSTPTTGSARYTGSPLSITSNMTLRFFSVDKAGNAEPIRSEAYVIDGVAPATAASPTGGTYTSAQTVTLSCGDSGGSGCAATYYTVDGSTPATGSPRYTAPISISANTTLKFFSMDGAGNAEAIRSETYVIDGVAPVTVASPPGGTYASARSITLSCGDGTGTGCAATYYTVDGSTPTTGSPRYTAPISVSANTTLRFFSVDGAGNAEAVKTETYVIDSVAPVTVASPTGGTYTSARSVTLSCSDSGGAGCAATYYTVDGSTPTTGSPRYTAPISISANATLKFFSMDGAGNAEPIRSEAYVIDGVAPVTVASPPGGSYASAQSVTLSCGDGGGTGCTATYYTVDGSTPATGSPRYTAAISISGDTTLRFFSVDAAGNAEAVKTEVYLIARTPGETSAQISAVRSAPDGSLSQPVEQALVTYVKPLTWTDPAGFFLQAEADGPALFVAVDPGTLTPMPRVGDRVSLTVTEKITVGSAVEAIAISNFTRAAQGVPIEPLRVDASAVNLGAAPGPYEHELLSVSGTLTGSFSSSGVDHLQAPLATTGSPSATNQRLRMPSHLQEQLDPGSGCSVTVRSPLWRFNTTAQPSVWDPQDLTIHSCPAPGVLSAAPSSATRVTVRFSRLIDPASVAANGSQFTLDNGLVASSATVSGRNVHLTTSSQVPGQSYSVTVAASVRDTLGTSLDSAAASASFTGFSPPAVLRITEVAPNITSQRHLIELQVLQGGSVSGMTLNSDNTQVARLPDVIVSTGDIIVVHFNPDIGSGADAPGPELTSKSEYPRATYPNNFDSAWDFHGSSGGLNYSNRVLRVRDAYGNTQDGVAFYHSEVLPTSSTQYAAQVRGLQAEGHWLPSSCGGAPCTHTSSPSVLEISAPWQGCSTDRSITVRRVGGGNSHTSADWSVGPSSLGVANP